MIFNISNIRKISPNNKFHARIIYYYMEKKYHILNYHLKC